ncbi:MAG: SLBB domain-containing protein [Candidatus Eiseniibacteriota bacterium]
MLSLLAGPAAAQPAAGRTTEELAARARAAVGAPVTAPEGATLEGAVDRAAYVLGPGDLLEIAYTGSSQPAERLRVSPSGRVQLAAAGPVDVAGLTLAGAETKLKDVLSRFYEGTRISVDVVEVRTFRVHLLGQVAAPGSFAVTATERASDLLDTRAELAPRASLRNLTLRRKSGAAVPVDLVRYRLLGDLGANPWLEDGDVLVVPAQRDSVFVFGRVPRPGFYELHAGDTIDDLVELAGGFDSGADTEAVELRRFDGQEAGALTKMTLDVSAGEGAIPAQADDGVYIRTKPDWRRVQLVELIGEVRYPGLYAIEEEGETLRELIARAGGLNEDADPSGTQVYRPNVFDKPQDDPEFRRLQAIPIQEMTDDEFEYLKLRSRQREGLASSVLAEALIGKERGEDLVLRAGDRISVPAQNLAVDVQGAVRNPGFVPWAPGRDARDYLELAGGKTDRARTGKTQIIRARTGEHVRAGGGTAVDPGDLVWVPESQDRDWWKITRETAVFLAQIGTLIVIVDSVTN